MDDDDFEIEEEEHFHPGDVVVLKSGGPEMTVKTVAGNPPAVAVVWFEDSTRHDEVFPAVTLELS